MRPDLVLWIAVVCVMPERVEPVGSTIRSRRLSSLPLNVYRMRWMIIKERTIVVVNYQWFSSPLCVCVLVQVPRFNLLAARAHS